jgi:peptide deformylase
MENKIKFVDNQMYEYTLYDRVDPYSDILKQKLEPFDFKNPPTDPRKLAVSLIETMVRYRGIGLSANQVGLPYRVFVMGAEKVGFACFNPEITDGIGEETYEEGCISIPGLFLKIKRYSTIYTKYTDMNGVEKEQRFDGLTARIFQHELDHMNGIMYTSKVSKTALELAKNKIKKNIKKVERTKEMNRILKTLESQKVENKEPQLLETPVKKEIPKTFEYTIP